MDMAKCVKFKRGQVWIVDDVFHDAKLRNQSHLMAKTRPYLIMTSDEVLMNEPEGNLIIQALPITSNVNSIQRVLYQGINFYAPEGLKHIMTSQLTAIDAKFFRQYLYTIPTEIVQDVETFVCARLGFHTTTVTAAMAIVKKYPQLPVNPLPIAQTQEIPAISQTVNNQESQVTVVPNTGDSTGSEVSDNTTNMRVIINWTSLMAREYVRLYDAHDYDGITQKFNVHGTRSMYSRYMYVKRKFKL